MTAVVLVIVLAAASCSTSDNPASDNTASPNPVSDGEAPESPESGSGASDSGASDNRGSDGSGSDGSEGAEPVGAEVGYDDLEHERAPVESLPPAAPTAEEIAAATARGQVIHFKAESVTTTDEGENGSSASDVHIQASGVLLTEAGQGFRTSSTEGTLGGTPVTAPQAALWFDGGRFFASDPMFPGQSYLASRNIARFVGLRFKELVIASNDDPDLVEPEPVLILEAEIVGALTTTTGLEIVGIEESDGTASLHLAGTNGGEADAPTAFDLWVDGQNRLLKLVTTTLPGTTVLATAATHTWTLRYLVVAPTLPERPALAGSESVESGVTGGEIPTAFDIAAASAAAPFIDFEQTLASSGLEFRAHTSLDVLAGTGFGESWAAAADGCSGYPTTSLSRLVT